METADLYSLLCCSMVPMLAVVWVVFLVEHLRDAAANRGLERSVFYCPNCRYNLSGIGSWECPECGSDPRRIGLLTRKSVRTLSLMSRVILWLAAGPFLILVTTSSFSMILEDAYDAYGYGIVVAILIWIAGLLWIGSGWDAQVRKRRVERNQQLRRFAEANGLPVQGIEDLRRPRDAS